jgi:hypothetical protein
MRVARAGVRRERTKGRKSRTWTTHHSGIAEHERELDEDEDAYMHMHMNMNRMSFARVPEGHPTLTPSHEPRTPAGMTLAEGLTQTYCSATLMRFHSILILILMLILIMTPVLPSCMSNVPPCCARSSPPLTDLLRNSDRDRDRDNRQPRMPRYSTVVPR